MSQPLGSFIDSKVRNFFRAVDAIGPTELEALRRELLEAYGLNAFVSFLPGGSFGVKITGRTGYSARQLSLRLEEDVEIYSVSRLAHNWCSTCDLPRARCSHSRAYGWGTPYGAANTIQDTIRYYTSTASNSTFNLDPMWGTTSATTYR